MKPHEENFSIEHKTGKSVFGTFISKSSWCANYYLTVCFVLSWLYMLNSHFIACYNINNVENKLIFFSYSYYPLFFITKLTPSDKQIRHQTVTLRVIKYKLNKSTKNTYFADVSNTNKLIKLLWIVLKFC